MSSRMGADQHCTTSLFKVSLTEAMTHQILFRFTGTNCLKLANELQARTISDDIYEAVVASNSDLARQLFAGRCKGCFVSWYRHKFTYESEELSVSTFVHAYTIREFVEPLANLAHFEFDKTCKCAVPLRQIRPIRLIRTPRTKDDIFRLSDGSWVCNQRFATELFKMHSDWVSFLPIFCDEKQYRSYLEADSHLNGLSEHFLSLAEIGEHQFVQAVFPVGVFQICPPTDGRQINFLPNDDDVNCHCKSVYDAGLSSELYLDQLSSDTRSASLTQNRIGNSLGLYLPTRELILTQNMYEIFTRYRTHSIEYRRTFVIDNSKSGNC